MNRACGTCTFFHPLASDHAGAARGTCRQRPPCVSEALLRHDIAQHGEPDNSSVYMATRFPVLEADDWCGQYGPNDAEVRREWQRTIAANDRYHPANVQGDESGEPF